MPTESPETTLPCNRYPSVPLAVRTDESGTLTSVGCGNVVVNTPVSGRDRVLCRGCNTDATGLLCEYARQASDALLLGQKPQPDQIHYREPGTGGSPESLLLGQLLSDYILVEGTFYHRRSAHSPVTGEQLLTSIPGKSFGLKPEKIQLMQAHLNQAGVHSAIRQYLADGRIDQALELIVQHHSLSVPLQREGEPLSIILHTNTGGVQLGCSIEEKLEDSLHFGFDQPTLEILEECAMIDRFNPADREASIINIFGHGYGVRPEEIDGAKARRKLVHSLLTDYEVALTGSDEVEFTGIRREATGNKLKTREVRSQLLGQKEPITLHPLHIIAFRKLAQRRQVIKEREQAEAPRRDAAFGEILSSYSLLFQPSGQLLLNRHAEHPGGDVTFAIGESGLINPGIVLHVGEGPICLTENQIEELRMCAENFALINCIGSADKVEVSQRLIALFHIDEDLTYSTGVLNFRLRPDGPILFTSLDLGKDAGATTSCPSIRGLGFDVADINSLKSASRIREDVEDIDVFDFDNIKGPVKLSQWIKCNFRPRIVDGECHFIPRSDRVVPEPYNTEGLTEENIVRSGMSPGGIKLNTLQFFALRQWADNEGMSEVRLEGTPRAGNGVARYRIFETLRDSKQAQLSFGRSGQLFYKAMLPVPESSQGKEREESKEPRDVRFFEFDTYEAMLRDIAGFRGIKS